MQATKIAYRARPRKFTVSMSVQAPEAATCVHQIPIAPCACGKLHRRFLNRCRPLQRGHPAVLQAQFHRPFAGRYQDCCLCGDLAPQCRRCWDRSIAQYAAKPRRIKPRMALAKRKKFGPMRCGMKRTATAKAVNQVAKPAATVTTPKPGAL